MKHKFLNSFQNENDRVVKYCHYVSVNFQAESFFVLDG